MFLLGELSVFQQLIVQKYRTETELIVVVILLDKLVL